MENAPVKDLNQNLVYSLYYLFKVIPAGISGFSIYLGYKLFILGVTGQASLSIQTDTVSGQLINAAPGLFFALGGIIALIITVWKGVKVNFSSDSTDKYGNRQMRRNSC